jgi:hypothetical protein
VANKSGEVTKTACDCIALPIATDCISMSSATFERIGAAAITMIADTSFVLQSHDTLYIRAYKYVNFFKEESNSDMQRRKMEQAFTRAIPYL